MNNPINSGLLQSDLDFAGFKALNADLTDYGIGGGQEITQNPQDGDYTFVLGDSGKHIFHDSATPHTYTIPSSGSVAFEVGTAITIVNNTGAGDISLLITGGTLRRGDGTAGTGSRTIGADSIATVLKTKDTEWMLGGTFT